MKKKLIVLFLSISLLICIGCSTSEINISDNNIEVKGLTLKISLITVAYDVYRANIGNSTTFNKEFYSKTGNYGLEYYKWLKDTYSSMDSSMKRKLINIFKDHGNWSYVSETISLDDNASVEEIVERLNSKSNLELSEMQKDNIDIFFKYFYKEHLKELIKENNSNIEKNTKEINSFLENKNIDIFKFMEESSGIKFKKGYKAVFYYDLSPIGAMGFEEGNLKISTILPNTTKKDLLSTPFHEYSHELFKSFTKGIDFKKMANKLIKDKDLYDTYENIGKDAYDWVGWCDENLVEGFAKYLEYKYYNNKSEKSLYAYDLKFCNYLIENNFNPENKSLEDISMEFYEKVLDGKL